MNRFIKFLATGGGAGYVPGAPGLAGSVVGLGYWWLLGRIGSPLLSWTVFVVVLAVAVWVAGAAAEQLRHPDPPCVVIDELVVVPLALAGLGGRWWPVVVAFALFRVLDVWKPPPIRQAQDFAGGVGIVLDDLLAALGACAVTHALVWGAARLQF